MATVLVTGGTGVLGTRLVAALMERNHQVRVLSRSTTSTVPEGVSVARGDVRTGDGLDAAIQGADVIVHAATNPIRHTRETEVIGTDHVLRYAGTHGVGHVVYVSIVGVDRNRLPYYKAKWAAEQLVEASPVPTTIQRLTQFHYLLERTLGLGMFPRTPSLAFQPMDSAEAAVKLCDLIDQGPLGRAQDVGGPEVLSIRELCDERRDVTGKRTILIPAPRLGPLRDFDAGYHLVPDHRYGHTTWAQWLATHAA